eukprot:6201168-Pleurochrysis_carterae.AAC.3
MNKLAYRYRVSVSDWQPHALRHGVGNFALSHSAALFATHAPRLELGAAGRAHAHDRASACTQIASTHPSPRAVYGIDGDLATAIISPVLGIPSLLCSYDS